MTVAENLHLDVARALHELLDQHAIIAETGLRLALGAGEGGFKIGVGIDLSHAAAAAAGDGLDEHGVADLLRSSLQRFEGLVLPMIARRNRDAVLFHQRLGGVLEAHGADRFRRRPDPGQPCLGDGFGEGCIF